MRKLLALSFLALAACLGGNETAAPPSVTSAVAATVPTASRDHLEAMRAEIAVVEMNPDVSFLTDEERQVVNLLNEAGSLMSAIYLRQISENNPVWRGEIAASGNPDKELLLDLFDLHFGPWDTLDDNKPFYGEAELPAGAGFYPADMTKEEFESWIAAHPGDEAAFKSGYTVIRRGEAEAQCRAIIEAGERDGKSYALPAYDQCIKASHLFNLLDARGVISVAERQSYILRVRTLAKACCEAWLKSPMGRTEGAGVVDYSAT